MAFDYARPKANADRLIQKFGQAGKVRRPTSTGTVYSPTPGAPQDHDAIFAVMDYTLQEIDGSRVLATDKKVYLAKGTLAIDPLTSDLLVEADGAVYRIIAVSPLKPATITVFYEIQARR